MNENLKNYTEQPDAEVWQKINGEMHKGRVRRQTIGAAVGVAMVAAAVVLMLRPAAPVEHPSAAPAGPAAAVAMAQTEYQQPVAQPTAVIDVGPETSVRQQTVEVQFQVSEPVPAVQSVQAAVVQAEQVVSDHAVTVTRQASVAPAEVPAAVQQSVTHSAVQSEAAQPVAEQQQTIEAKSGVAGKIQDTILWLPNVFVPGSDDPEVNSFRARLNKPSSYVSNFKMTIFNRGGHQVFHSNDINVGWNGTYNGQALPQASYVYIIYYTDKDRVQHQRKGTITLVR